MSDTDQNEDNLLAPLHEFHQRSQELVKLARAGDWATLEERLAEREKGLPALGDNQFLIAVAKADQTEQLREGIAAIRSEEHTSELQSRGHLVCRLLLDN